MQLKKYEEQDAPYVTGSDYVCQSGSVFRFYELPDGFNAPEWEVTPSLYFNGSTSDTGTLVLVTPKSEYIGKECTITFTISDDCGSAEYSKDFVINGPEEDQISIEVEDSYGSSPSKYGDIWLLCPSTTYYMYLNNNSGCSTSYYDWVLPSAWTKYYAYNNYVSINTNSNPSGTMEVWANTCCGGSKVKIKTQYFSYGYNCGGYYSVYPNPASSEFVISLSDKLDLDSTEKTIEIYDSNYKLKRILKNIRKENTISTNDWKEGIYYIRLEYNGTYYYGKVQVSH